MDFQKFQYDLGHARKLGVDDPLIRAIGKVRTVVDATAGLGRDAAALALAGYDVTACERAPAIAGMWKRARLPKRLAFLEGDARTLVTALSAPPEAIYIDPMYPGHDDRTAAPAREMLELRALVGDDDDAGELLAVARKTALLRVVVKRPARAPPLAPDVSQSWQGASTRYDLYLRSAEIKTASV